MRLVPLFIAAAIALGMALTQYYALINYWYWTYWWLDIVMHGAGGVVVGLLVYQYVTKRFLYLLALSLVVGVVWEVFEFAIGISVAEPHFVSDSLLDLMMDGMGSTLAYGMMLEWETYASRLIAARGASQDQISL